MFERVNQLASSGKKAKLTGSGSCFYIECVTEQEAQSIAKHLSEDCLSFIANSVQRSPLHTSLNVYK